MQEILILGAGKSATVLIESLLNDAVKEDWFVHVADVQVHLAERKTAGHSRAAAYGINLENEDQLNRLILGADAVISMLPPPFHFKVARKCLQHQVHFLNASYLSPDLQSLDEDVREAGLSFLCEMGLDPGIDHMSAMEMIHDIGKGGGTIHSFRSHCGGLISPESDNNPWHYKISWNPRNIILAGKDGATYLSGKQVCQVGYTDLFDPQRIVEVPGYGAFAWYPNRDSIPYIRKYGLEGISDFVRTTLRHPHFAHGWKKVVDLGLTDETRKRDTTDVTLRDFFAPYLHQLSSWDPVLQEQFRFLDLERNTLINKGLSSNADVLQIVMEEKLALEEDDKDMIVMMHELEYSMPGSGALRKTTASLVVKGEDPVHTAMAKTVGLPLASAVKHILRGTIQRKGVFIPLYEDIYTAVLPDLEQQGIRFTITE